MSSGTGWRESSAQARTPGKDAGPRGLGRPMQKDEKVVKYKRSGVSQVVRPGRYGR